ncbi:MAG TPA: alpha/beta fold hydrolase [Vicinamibacterales bacterium]|nr:alpha/beta fold hydrolase [Vicinamibacterales bacterium]
MTDAYDSRLSIHGSGEAVILVSGMDGTGKLFYRQVPLLARSYRVATYALRDAAATMDQLVADLSRVIDTVAPTERRATVIGESFGGALALSFALARPDQVNRLVILNSFPHFTPQIRLHLARFGLRALPWGAMAVVRRLTASRLHSRHTHRQEIRRFLELTASASRDGYCNRLKLLTRYDVRQRLCELRRPTLFLASEHDHLVPSIAQARYMAARVPMSTVRILEGHGHICLIAPDLDLSDVLDTWRG